MLIDELNAVRNAAIENMYQSLRENMLAIAKNGGRTLCFLEHSDPGIQASVRMMLIDGGLREENICTHNVFGATLRSDTWIGDVSRGIPYPTIDRHCSYSVCSVSWGYDGD